MDEHDQLNVKQCATKYFNGRIADLTFQTWEQNPSVLAKYDFRLGILEDAFVDVTGKGPVACSSMHQPGLSRVMIGMDQSATGRKRNMAMAPSISTTMSWMTRAGIQISPSQSPLVFTLAPM